jgi:hypothetical protein
VVGQGRGRLVVGSTSTRELLSSARRISSSCFWPMPSSCTGVSGATWRPNSASSTIVRACIPAQSMSPRRRGSRPRKRFSATLSSSTSANSWVMTAMPAASASRMPANRAGAPSTRISPS